MYIGPVYIPAVGIFNTDKQNKKIKQIKALNLSSPHIAEFQPDAIQFALEGTLYQENGTAKTAEQYADDLLGLMQVTSAYNYVDFHNRRGFCTVRDVNAPLESGRQLDRKCSISGLFLPSNKYQRRLHTNPVILANDFSLTLGASGCDNYVPLPIGSTYSGGDGSTITRVGADGTQTLVLATSDNDIKFDLDADEVDVGECKCWDSVIAGDATESNWIRVFNVDHEFSGDAIFENGLIRVKSRIAAGRARFYAHIASVWTFVTELKIGALTQQSASVYKITSITPDKLEFTIQFYDATLEIYGKEDFVLQRGCYSVDRASQETHSGAMEAIQFTPRFAYLENTLYDVDLEGLGFTIATSTMPHCIVFDPTLNYIIIGISEETGTKAYRNTTYISGIQNSAIGANDHFINAIIPFPSAANLFKECEDMTQGAGTAFYTGTDASPKAGNTGTILNAQNENVYYEITGGVTLPLGTYKLFLRAQDANQVTGDISVLVRNTTDGTDVMAKTTKTLTGSFAYVSFDVTLAVDDDTDTIRITINKETATANAIDLDYILWVPTTLDSGNGPQDVAHQAMVNSRLKRELVAR